MKLRVPMAAACLGAACLAAASPGVAAPSPYAPIQPGQLVSPLQSVTLYVRDMDDALKVYRDLLKLHVFSDTTKDGERTVHMGAADKPIGQLFLVSLGAKGGTAPPPLAEPYGHSGDFAVVFPTNDIWTIYDKLVADRYQIMSPPVTLMHNPNMRVQALEMSFRDKDGVYVNIVQSSQP